MNIDKIAAEAGFSVTRNTTSTLWEDGIHACSKRPLPFERVECEEQLKKFAELIILECANVAGDYLENACEDGQIPDSLFTKRDIKQHFGME